MIRSKIYRWVGNRGFGNRLMVRLLFRICAILMVLGGLAPAQGPATQNAARRLHRPHRLPTDSPDPVLTSAPQIQPALLVQQPPAQPARPPQTAPPAAPTPAPVAQAPEHLPPPTPAQVTYQNGLLTVQALNSTLGGLLTAIRNKTGIQFEGLEGGAQERVAIVMGPARESEVLAAILGGSSFDYVVLGRPDSPGVVQRVLLMPRGGATPAVAGAQPPRPTNADGDEEDTPEEQASGDPEPQDTPARPPVTQAEPQQQPQPDQQPKTAEQLMQQLIQMNQQKLQQQQQQQQQVPPQNQAPIKPPAVPQ
jgi:hypothetical protein